MAVSRASRTQTCSHDASKEICEGILHLNPREHQRERHADGRAEKDKGRQQEKAGDAFEGFLKVDHSASMMLLRLAAYSSSVMVPASRRAPSVRRRLSKSRDGVAVATGVSFCGSRLGSAVKVIGA
jgi:hypothetical protein